MAKARTRTITRYVSRRKRSRKQMTIPLAVVAGLAIPASRAWGHHNIEGGLKQLAYDFTGWNAWTNKWEGWYGMKNGVLPVGLGFLLHKLANRFGVNRALANAGIPYIRL